MWMLACGQLLTNRGSVFSALNATGLADDAVRRAWAAFRGGLWCIVLLIRVWQRHVEGLPRSFLRGSSLSFENQRKLVELGLDL